MILPPGFRGAAFGAATDGDGRTHPEARRAISEHLGIPETWAWLRQVHGRGVVRAEGPGCLGEADAIFTTVAGLPLAVGTADCFPVVVEAEAASGIAHAGWRGAAAGVVPALAAAMGAAGHRPRKAAIGPGIGPCCFEVGPEVAARFPDHRARTSGGAPSIDLGAAIASQLGGIEVWVAPQCTHCDPAYRSYRRDRTRHRQVGLAWEP
jgi:YfiH family protein